MNWNSLLRRAVIGFITIFFLAYLVPGLSALTISHIIVVSLLMAFLTTVGENTIVADTRGKKSSLLFVVSAVTVYFYGLVIVGTRLPVVTVLLTTALITLFDQLSTAQNENRVTEEDGVREEGNERYQE